MLLETQFQTWAVDGTVRPDNSSSSWIPSKGIRALTLQSISVDLRQWARSGRKTGDMPPRNQPPDLIRRPSRFSGVGGKPEGWPRSGQVTERPGNPVIERKPKTSHSSARVARLRLSTPWCCLATWRVPAHYRWKQHVFMLFSCSGATTQRLMTGLSIPVWTMTVHGVLPIRPHDQLPYIWTNTVTMSHSEWVILACTFLSGELPATNSLTPRTVPRLSALAQAHYTIPIVPPSLDFLFLRQWSVTFIKFSRNYKALWQRSQVSMLLVNTYFHYNKYRLCPI